jgi:AcrR family transcriptional regulator
MEAGDASRQRLLDSALRLFASKGFEAVGIRELADAAGMTSASIYYHTGSKDDLLFDLMRDCLEGLVSGATEIAGLDQSTAQALSALVRFHVRVHAEQQLACTVTDSDLRSLSGANRDAVMQLRDDYQSLWHEVIAAGLGRGEMQTDNASLATLAVLEMCTGVAHWYSPSGSLSVDEICDAYAGIALRAVGARLVVTS